MIKNNLNNNNLILEYPKLERKVKQHFCNGCGESDPSKFYTNKKSICKKCISLNEDYQYDINKGGITKGYLCKKCGVNDSSLFYEFHKSLCKERTRKKRKEEYSYDPTYFRLWREKLKEDLKSFIHHKFVQAWNNAKIRKIEFTLTEEDINEILKSQGNRCYYTKIQFNNQIEEFSLSIDRTNSGKGYVKENCRLVLSIVNYMKKHYSEDTFFQIIKQIYENCQLSKKSCGR